jgi:hypothetical protein
MAGCAYHYGWGCGEQGGFIHVAIDELVEHLMTNAQQPTAYKHGMLNVSTTTTTTTPLYLVCPSSQSLMIQSHSSIYSAQIYNGNIFKC